MSIHNHGKNKNFLKKKKKNKKQLESRKDGLKFTSPTLSDINAQWKKLTESTRDRQVCVLFYFVLSIVNIKKKK